MNASPRYDARGEAGMELGTILGIWAHPDDETYLSAGLMAEAVDRGSRVVCITATRGEGGSMDEERWPPDTMGSVRERELLRSLARIGVNEHHWLDYPDIDMDTPLPDAGAARVREIMAEVQPDTVLTFGPDGMTGHLAHMSVCTWATQAFEDVAPSGSCLHYATMTPAYVEEFQAIFEPLEMFRPGTPPVTPPEELSIDLALDEDALDRKFAAIQEHESQIGYIVDAIGADVFRREMANEWFRLASTKP
ncbi:MAG TPA: PIG-L family deacetylase [Actinomycetota bacterium]